jgi:hypothetical protein
VIDMTVPPTAIPSTLPVCRTVLVTADPAPARSNGGVLINAAVTGLSAADPRMYRPAYGSEQRI